MDDWATHIHALAAAVVNTKGPILELGCGEYSTPLLHALRGDFEVVSVESNREWARRFERLYQKDGHLLVVDSIEEHLARPISSGWGVIFIDHAPGESRAAAIKTLARHAEVIVVHDTDAACYEWGDCWVPFAWHWTHKRYPTWTTLVGHGERPAWVERALPEGEAGAPVPWR